MNANEVMYYQRVTLPITLTGLAASAAWQSSTVDLSNYKHPEILLEIKAKTVAGTLTLPGYLAVYIMPSTGSNDDYGASLTGVDGTLATIPSYPNSIYLGSLNFNTANADTRRVLPIARKLGYVPQKFVIWVVNYSNLNLTSVTGDNLIQFRGVKNWTAR